MVLADGNVIKQWTQKPLSVSRVMQVWRDMVGRDQLLADEASTPFLQRKHHKMQETGFARVAAHVGPRQLPKSVVEKVKEARENA